MSLLERFYHIYLARSVGGCLYQFSLLCFFTIHEHWTSLNGCRLTVDFHRLWKYRESPGDACDKILHVRYHSSRTEAPAV